MKLGGVPSEFLKQTPRSFVICMEGMAHAANREFDLSIITSWHTARFALNGYANKGKLAGNKTLSDLLSGQESNPHNDAVQAVAFFHSMKAAGMDVQIERVVH